LEDALKKFVYLDRIPNLEVALNKNKSVNAYEFYVLAKNLLNL
jgi:hypothetical protein